MTKLNTNTAGLYSRPTITGGVILAVNRSNVADHVTAAWNTPTSSNPITCAALACRTAYSALKPVAGQISTKLYYRMFAEIERLINLTAGTPGEEMY